MPDAKDIDAFWQNITQGKVSIKDVKPERWPGKVEDLENRWWEMLKKASPIPKLALLLKDLNSIGADGVNRQRLLGKLTRAKW